ncbi:unnamed protein product (macronuclear) [Paramecium tetraurelia]|uniref:J domain-containing protein n=1 Tax=Paramecium tetraurelia TaxID=5888 RepID=A0DNL0_PARTE|nr:uncharacterized protein GSPATT00018823001 [Paramecium tetraurelia]CAK84627.1 unnamed protein product [Paramecium tetraurelia]|eukprot:XP_001452024.1 hypothetical protein (macronuclear) [Paramecium tetraurelia strain d4-2]
MIITTNCYYQRKEPNRMKIRKQFRELSRTLHPDKKEGNQTQYVNSVKKQRLIMKSILKIQIEVNFIITIDIINMYIILKQIHIFLFLEQPCSYLSFNMWLEFVLMESTHFKKVVKERYKESNLSKQQVIQETLEEVKISRAWSYPTFEEIWIIAILHFIYSIFYRLYFAIKWKYYYKYQKCRKEISEKDQEYKTQLILGISQSRQEIVDKESLVNQQLWILENMKEFDEGQLLKQDEYIQQHSNKFKQYMRLTCKSVSKIYKFVLFSYEINHQYLHGLRCF